MSRASNGNQRFHFAAVSLEFLMKTDLLMLPCSEEFTHIVRFGTCSSFECISTLALKRCGYMQCTTFTRTMSLKLGSKISITHKCYISPG